MKSKNPNWNNSIAIITGGGSGIGRSLAISLAGKGAFVLICDVNLESAQQVAQLCGSNSSAHELDVRDSEKVKDFMITTFERFGKIDYLFNNAGIAIGGECFEISLESWLRILDINVKGVINGVTAVYPLMVKQKFGHIINTASLAGLGPAPLLTPYSMTKHAIVGLSTSLRLEAKKYNVKVSVLCPSAIETPLLDSNFPADLGDAPWRPNFRRFLTALGGPPYDVDKLAEGAIKAIEKNQAIIVIPGAAYLAWTIGKLFPKLAEKICDKALEVERADRK
jgi:NAD(P)-dependent dehydrogenase (short-subunit alcohol dehydrogenase family)